MLLFCAGCFSVHAQEPIQVQKQPEIIKSPVKWLQTSELPVQATGSDGEATKPGLVENTIDWFRKTDLPGDLQIHGFASQAYITTSDNDVFGNSDNGGSFGLTETGLNVSARPLPRLQVSAQVLSRRAGKGSSGMPRLDYGFLDYRVYSHEVNQFGIRVGRLKNPFGFYNDTRDVPFTRPTIMLPQSIYFDRTRNVSLSGDSVQLYGEAAVSKWGTVSTQFGVFLPIVSDRDTETALLGTTRPGHLERDVSYIGRGIFETNDKRLRLGISGIWLNTSYDPNRRLNDSIGPGALQFTPIYFSAQYNAERWTLTSEYAIRSFQYNNDFGNNPTVRGLNGLNFVGESYYFQGEYRFTPNWTGILRYDALYTDRADRDGSEFAKRTKGPAESRFAKDITVGLRWDATPKFMLRAEYHYVNGTAWLSRLDNPTSEGPLSQHWHLFAIQASYRF
ncbi:OprO/OprP family phosphate-selective porin [Nitrosomonas supralitoralis]|uniref:OprO/OprP family phosphate-selective porin n=1 Tax=Nitrosomonas supralitoralis TaxID=2116706 RepID=UPI001F5BC070|nr:OprO/OprP family phosphate-selective porin [Nitrosomonas supralitoralis]